MQTSCAKILFHITNSLKQKPNYGSLLNLAESFFIMVYYPVADPGAGVQGPHPIQIQKKYIIWKKGVFLEGKGVKNMVNSPLEENLSKNLQTPSMTELWIHHCYYPFENSTNTAVKELQCSQFANPKLYTVSSFRL